MCGGGFPSGVGCMGRRFTINGFDGESVDESSDFGLCIGVICGIIG